jgi:hypothetical protein
MKAISYELAGLAGPSISPGRTISRARLLIECLNHIEMML